MRINTPGVTHVIGGGLAGLACSVALAAKGRRIILHEASRQAGGRCRSYHDAKLDRQIDNGNHLVLSGNKTLFRFLHQTGGRNHITIARQALYPFYDLREGTRWDIHFNRGLIPWWIFREKRRPPGSKPSDYLAILKLARAAPSSVVNDIFPPSTRLHTQLWDPFTIGILNTPPDRAAACLLWPVLSQTFLRGARYCRPCAFPQGLGKALIEPAIRFLNTHNMQIGFGRRLQKLTLAEGKVKILHFHQDDIPLGETDHVILATPPSITQSLYPLPDIPSGTQTIINVHFRLPAPPAWPYQAHFLGLIGGISQWIFIRDDVVSLTISAANDLHHQDPEDIATLTWPEVKTALHIHTRTRHLPPYRVIKEKQATFSQTPDSLRQRPPCQTDLSNLFLAGDWTDTGLPATLEGAAFSGVQAASLSQAGGF